MLTRIQICLLCLSLPALAQQSAPPDRRVTLDVVVTDKSGKPVPGLQQTDFTIIDNKQPQQILSFQAMDRKAADLPVEVILLVDAINTEVDNTSNARLLLKKYLSQNGGQLALPTSMVFYSNSATNIQKTATRDGNALLAEVDKNVSGLRSVTKSTAYGESDRFHMSFDALNQIVAIEETKPGRKLLIWLSSGWPLLSGPNMNLTTKMRQDLFNAAVLVSRELMRARVTLYSVDTLGVANAGSVDVNQYRQYLKGVTGPKQMEPGNLALQVIATQTGGRVLTTDHDLGRQIENCMNDTDAWYVLSFDAPHPDGPNEYHKLDVKMGKGGLTARTLTGYYPQP